METPHKIMLYAAIVATVNVAVVSFLTYAIWRLTAKVDKTQQLQRLADAFNTRNSIALSDPDRLNDLESLYREPETDRAAQRLKWTTFTVLQTHQLAFYAWWEGTYDGEDFKRFASQIMHLVFKGQHGDLVLKLATTRGFRAQFAKFCTSLAAMPDNPTDEEWHALLKAQGRKRRFVH